MNLLTIKKVSTFIAFALIMLIGWYFIIKYIPRYFVFTEKSYTTYFWPKRNWLFMHIICGMLATIIGSFQFMPVIRNNYIKLHRMMGQIYLLSVGFGSLGAFYLAFTAVLNLAYNVAVICFAFVWFSTAFMAYLSIRNLNIGQHREWMIRCYVVTAAFSTIRLATEVLLALNISTEEMILTFLSWAGWAIPLFITELILQGSKILAARRVQKNI